jgi:hypothetical protein
LDGGAGGIRTLDRALQPYNGLANRRLQPLGHSSVTADMPDAAACRKRQISGWWISRHLWRLQAELMDRKAFGLGHRRSRQRCVARKSQDTVSIRSSVAPADWGTSVCALFWAHALMGIRATGWYCARRKIAPVKIGSMSCDALASCDRDSFQACETGAFCNFVGTRI